LPCEGQVALGLTDVNVDRREVGGAEAVVGLYGELGLAAGDDDELSTVSRNDGGSPRPAKEAEHSRRGSIRRAFFSFVEKSIPPIARLT
jgi:hypothetical protein